jgi:glucose-1-phosphate cytidylyltransferase
MTNFKQVVILAGGKGTRMREMTEDLPKPMVTIGGMPVLDHLIGIFRRFGKFKFIVCVGYLGEKIESHYKGNDNVEVVFTGEETETGGRLFKVRDLLDDNFLFTYGDGLANVDISKLISEHQKHDKTGTITVTNPVSRFGLIEFDRQMKVQKFIEKPKLEGFVNIGFMAFNKNIFNYIDDDSILESSPLINLSKDSELFVNIHEGFFEPMDTYREYLNLNKLWSNGNPPWLRDI